ncbi:MAG TPA: S53 family peptidase [Terriglobia bacterium]|nr:S53 family peptidase [Terriglobia bacterium]
MSVRLPSVPGTLFVPKSSLPQTPPAGHKFAASTNVEVFIPAGLKPEEAPPFPGYGYETPASLACHYGLVTVASGISPNCNPNSTTVNPTGGKNTIAIVDAYDDPAAPGDLAWFSLQFGLPLTLTQFQVVWANTATSSCNFAGVPVDYTGGWEVEESLDIEWAHAMAPGANLYLVEACSNYDSDLQQAVLVANNLVQCGATKIDPSTLNLGTCSTVTGKGEVSMSWGAGEYAGETAYDSSFAATNIVYFASAGDGPGVIYPGTSPNVVSAGGTTNRRSPSTFNWIAEAAWVDGGGGQSAYEKIPSYQTTYIPTLCKTWRCVPDLSFDSDPYTGVYVYDTFPVEGIDYLEWLVVGGTSAAAPALAGIVNNAGGFAASTNAELTTIYKNKAVTADITDITTGFCGFYMGFSAVAGWDPCTGVGVPHTYAGK